MAGKVILVTHDWGDRLADNLLCGHELRRRFRTIVAGWMSAGVIREAAG
jgi:hypothetical protein